MALHHSFKISVDLCLVLALLHDGHPTRLVQVQRVNRGDRFRGFLLSQW